MATKIIGHRGAAGLALENSRDSIRSALSYNIDAIEFDVRRTSDGKLVVLHDRHTGRIATQKIYAHKATLAELQSLTLKNGQRIPTLDEVLTQVKGKKPVVIDIKNDNSVDEIVAVLARHPEITAEFTSLRHGELLKLQHIFPNSPTYVLEHFSPFEIVRIAHQLRATGISLNMWLMNPLTYQLARRSHLELRVYTINNPLIYKFFRFFYPDVTIFTDHPERFTGKVRKSPTR